MDDLYSDDLYTLFLDSSASIFAPRLLPGSFTLSSHLLDFLLLGSLFSISVTSSVVMLRWDPSRPPPSQPFLVPQTTRQRFTERCQQLRTTLTQTPTHGCQLGDSGVSPSFIFPGLVHSLLLSLCSLSLSLAASLPLTSGINRAKLIPTFSRIMSASAVMQEEGERERERERA